MIWESNYRHPMVDLVRFSISLDKVAPVQEYVRSVRPLNLTKHRLPCCFRRSFATRSFFNTDFCQGLTFSPRSHNRTTEIADGFPHSHLSCHGPPVSISERRSPAYGVSHLPNMLYQLCKDHTETHSNPWRPVWDKLVAKLFTGFSTGLCNLDLYIRNDVLCCCSRS